MLVSVLIERLKLPLRRSVSTSGAIADISLGLSKDGVSFGGGLPICLVGDSLKPRGFRRRKCGLQRFLFEMSQVEIKSSSIVAVLGRKYLVLVVGSQVGR